MDVWLIDRNGVMNHIIVPWHTNIHVHAKKEYLDKLIDWLELPEISTRFTIGNIRFVKKRLSLDEYEMHNVLEIDVIDCRNIRRLAKHIESQGEYDRFTLYSVDAHLAQRFFVEYGIAPFHLVEWDGAYFSKLEQGDEWPKMKVIELDFEYDSPNGFDTVDSHLSQIKITTGDIIDGCEEEIFLIKNTISTKNFLADLSNRIYAIDPDIIVTRGGDRLHFPVLNKMNNQSKSNFTLSRKAADLVPRTMSRVVHSYGQVIRKDSYFPLHGRLHLDLNSSFIVREGGILGLFELSRHSRQSPQDISRLSPGSVISAIQMCVAMEDLVLVPWKKNRSEDTKTAWELLAADRGGLYLDSKPGVYSDVIELDFASLFPSIIATRNISPETLNCACCQAPDRPPEIDNFVPLNPDDAARVFRKRTQKEMFASKLFPSENASALQVPGLASHTCARVQGFLGRVVAPLIERRRVLKSKRKYKGDLYDLQQNALKWLLVTCFGYTGYKNARFGRIEAHEAICAWAREILLTTISVAEDEGWNVLHAIVDCVWIEKPDIKDRDQKFELAMKLSNRLTEEIGIPLEFEDMYDFIAFLPSRMHNSGSLTKYWAHGNNGLKLRGIEARQHSTCEWIRQIQSGALEILTNCVKGGEPVNSLAIQKRIMKMFQSELHLLESGCIDPSRLVLTRRVSKNIGDFSVKTITLCALLRAKRLGHGVDPGRKIKFVVTKSQNSDPLSKIILAEELQNYVQVPINVPHYKALAQRAIWAILGPFGWTDEEISKGVKKITLFDFFNSLDSKSSVDDSAY